MSLIIDAAAEKLGGTGTLISSGATGATLCAWVKRANSTNDYQYFARADDDASWTNGLSLGHAASSNSYSHIKAQNGETSFTSGMTGADSTTVWQFLAIRFIGGALGKASNGLAGGSLSHYDFNSSAAATFSLDIDRINFGDLAGNHFRGKIAHAALYNDDLSDSQIAELFNGGAGGYGKNPQAVANANLVFYATFATDATVTVSGISLTPTGSVSYDTGDDPNVEAYGSTHNVTMANGVTATTVSVGTIYSSNTGTLTTAPLKNNTGTLLALETGATAYIYSMTTGALVVAKTDQVTNTSGVMVISDAAIVPSTQYRIVVKLASTAEGLDKLTAT